MANTGDWWLTTICYQRVGLEMAPVLLQGSFTVGRRFTRCPHAIDRDGLPGLGLQSCGWQAEGLQWVRTVCNIVDAVPDSTVHILTRTALTSRLFIPSRNYGDTNWRGINKVLLQNGWIYSSAARMNEYYNGNNDPSQMQYTMCHEVSIAGELGGVFCKSF
jgi:hypothetical protein